MLLSGLADEDFPRRRHLDALGGGLLGLELASALFGLDDERGWGEDSGALFCWCFFCEEFFFFLSEFSRPSRSKKSKQEKKKTEQQPAAVAAADEKKTRIVLKFHPSRIPFSSVPVPPRREEPAAMSQQSRTPSAMRSERPVICVERGSEIRGEYFFFFFVVVASRPLLTTSMLRNQFEMFTAFRTLRRASVYVKAARQSQ